MKKKKLTWPIHAAVATLMLGMLATPVGAQTYGGDATGALVTVPATGTTIRAATGTIPISGGGVEAALEAGDIPGSATGGVVSLAAGTMHAAIVGLFATKSEASLADINLTVSGNQITSDFLMSRSSRTCEAEDNDDGGETHHRNLVVNGQSIVVTGLPNQTVTLPNGTVIINRQFSSNVGTSKELTVQALYVTTTDAITHQQLAEVVLAESDSKIDCGGGQRPPELWTTGGGWIYPRFPAMDRATFGFAAGMKDGMPKGHVVYKDPAVNARMKSTAILTVENSCVTHIHGKGQTPTGEVDFDVYATDSKATGDRFTISWSGLGGEYSAEGDVQGGNIKVHDQFCP
jgi:hypothetical protein